LIWTITITFENIPSQKKLKNRVKDPSQELNQWQLSMTAIRQYRSSTVVNHSRIVQHIGHIITQHINAFVKTTNQPKSSTQS
jgi:hypothetical protein